MEGRRVYLLWGGRKEPVFEKGKADQKLVNSNKYKEEIALLRFRLILPLLSTLVGVIFFIGMNNC